MRVPCGTLVYEILKEEEVEKKKFIIDLSENKKVFVLAKGGQKGKGNK